MVLILVAFVGCASAPPPTPKAHTQPLPGRWHRVAAGEDVAAVAARYNVRLQDVEEINGVDRRDKLPLGKLLFVPHASTSPTSAPSKTNKAVTKGQTGKLRWPVAGGTLTSTFGRRGKRRHEGIDIGAKEGTPVLAAAGGTVIYCGSGIKGYGNLVILRHPSGLVTVYAHNKRNLVRDGQKVRAGETIAEVGSSGRASGPHLHFEVRIGDKPVDPLGHVQLP